MSYLETIKKKYSESPNTPLTKLTKAKARSDNEQKLPYVSNVSAYLAHLKYDISLGELKFAAGEDWYLVKNSREMIDSLLHAIQTRKLIERGIRPAHYTEKANCKQCGPIWLWVSVDVEGCPWCFVKSANVLIPEKAGE